MLSADREDGEGREEEPYRRVPVALQREDPGPDHEAETEKIQRITENRVPVTEKDEAEVSLDGLGSTRSHRTIVSRAAPPGP